MDGLSNLDLDKTHLLTIDPGLIIISNASFAKRKGIKGMRLVP